MTKIEFTKEQEKEIITALLTGGKIHFRGSKFRFMEWNVEKTQAKSNLTKENISMLKQMLKVSKSFNTELKRELRKELSTVDDSISLLTN